MMNGLLNHLLKTVRPLVPDAWRDRGAREYFNHHYASLGHMTTLQIDSANQRATLDLNLKGEIQPLHVVIEKYEITTAENGQTFLEIKQMTTSREWLNLAARELLKDRKFPVPEIIKSLF